jgi:uncharacterized repeat protein (TIGR02543 family)
MGIITLPNSTGFSKEGYVFDSWNTNADGTGETYSAGSSYTVIGNATLFAKWVYPTITYNINGGSGTTPASQTVISGSTITLPDSTGFSKSGYILGGWNTNADGTGINYNAGSSYTVSGNVTLYAKWLELYTITFNLNGGTGTTPAAQTAGSGFTITLPGGNGLSKSGYIFGGWNTNTGGTGETYSADSSYTVTGNITLYAKWDTAYTVTFNINGGTGTTPAAQTVSSGSTITLPGEGGFSKNGYTLGGWNTNADGTGTNYNAGSSYTVTGNITLYAKWNENIGTITSPLWIEGKAVSLDAPAVILPVGQTVTAQGWQISDTGSGGWANFTLPTTAAMSMNGKYLRYYTVSSNGSTFYSNAVIIIVIDPNNMIVTNTTEWNTVKTLISGGGDNQAYTINVSGNVGVGGSGANTFGTAAGITVTLKGSGRLYLTGQGSLMRLGADQTMIIDSAGLTLQGLKNGQNGATQDNNIAAVYVDAAQLELRNGTISGNTTYLDSSNPLGGGVYVKGGTFTMSGGEISGNTSTSTSYSSSSYGGGVYVEGGTFTMSGGEISGNTTSGRSAYGGGVFVSGSFTMNGGEISGNTASSFFNAYYGNAYGGGVSLSGSFTMNSGKIRGNTASSVEYARGGGVLVNTSGSFTMNGGEISGNTCTGGTYIYGGGVYVYGNFRIVTGTVYGSSDTDTSLRNTVTGTYTYGAALYGTAQRGTFNGTTWVSKGDLSTTNNTIRIVNGEFIIADITGPVWHESSAVSLVAPLVTPPIGETVTAQGWQISDTGNGGWTNFTPPVAALMSYSSKYLRYYAALSGGQTYYSNVVVILVFDSNNMVMVTNTEGWNAVRSIISGGGNNKTYTINVSGNVGVGGSAANTFGTATGITVTLKGSGRLYLTSAGRLMDLGADQTLIIDSAGLTLQGLKNGQNGATQDNDRPFVWVYGQLELRNGTISGNFNPSANFSGGGVIVRENGTFTMNGGTISGNTGYTGGGVIVSENGTFIMNGGEISGNTARGGAGVQVYGNGTFRIVNGTVYGSGAGALSNTNTATSGAASLYNEGTAQRGTFNGETWVSSGDLSTTNSTIRVVNGVLQ